MGIGAKAKVHNETRQDDKTQQNECKKSPIFFLLSLGNWFSFVLISKFYLCIFFLLVRDESLFLEQVDSIVYTLMVLNLQ